MAGELTRVGQQDALDAFSGRATVTAQTTYLALCTADPGKAPTVAGLAELTTSGYARQTCVWTAPTAADPSVVQNNATITFGPFTADPPSATHLALVTSASGTTGNVRGKWTLDVAKDAATSESIQIAAGAVTMSLD